MQARLGIRFLPLIPPRTEPALAPCSVIDPKQRGHLAAYTRAYDPQQPVDGQPIRRQG